MREKVLNRSLREKVETAYLIAYKKSSYDSIKDYISHLDNLTLSNLCKHIPEIKPTTPEKDPVEESNRKMADDTSRRLMQMRKDRLK